MRSPRRCRKEGAGSLKIFNHSSFTAKKAKFKTAARKSGTVLIALAVLLLSSSCGKKEENPAGLYDRASGVASDLVLLTVNGRDVPAARYFYWLTADCDYLAEQSGGVPDWNTPLDGQTLGEYAKEQALLATVFYAVVEELAEQQNCVLTTEDLEAIEEDWAAQAETYGGEDAYLAALAKRGLDQAGAQLFSADYYLYEHLRQLSRTGGSELSPADGEVASYAEEANLYTADVLRFSEEEKATQARAALETDPTQNPAKLAENSSDFSTITAAYGDGTLSAEAESLLDDLKTGSWSQPVKTDKGVYLVRPIMLDSTAASDLWFEQHIQQLAADAKVELSKEYESFTAASFYEGLTLARQPAS